MAERREMQMPSLKPMLLLKQMQSLTMAMEVMVVMAMADMADTDMVAKGDLLNPDMDMVDTVMEAMVAMDMAVMDMEDMGTMVDSIRRHKHGCTLVTVNKKQKLRRVLASVVEVM